MIRSLLAIALFAGLAAATSVSWSEEGDRRPPFITTPSDVVERMLSLASTGPQDLVVDLGSGDGRIVITAAQKFGARGLGIELDKELVEKSRDNARIAKVADRVSFVHGDVLVSDISKATVVTVYLLPSLLDKLQPRFVDELKPGTRIVSHAFPMVGWKPDRSEQMQIAQRHRGQGDDSMLFLWVVPADARGQWLAGDWQVRIQQNYQELDVEAKRGGKTLDITQARVNGTGISWEADGVRFSGRVAGGRIAGELVESGRSVPLTFTRAR
jgi:protein-L-isoaspartate O-methyltransferase